ncbi:CAMK family protein kinase [Tritrichomonas foetus]|uniref:CAMK family protein kinase n=1 Tax=Tritrichomonas foetus TaxID=1144522 RepID=A0A1J4JD64_9EUKA|nr:CAMK family protein kinase [Tritrichomonas foetus]|eukprot:OHS95619.1 CAMK family protein kinase [Tritrichomonas foetus]
MTFVYYIEIISVGFEHFELIFFLFSSIFVNLNDSKKLRFTNKYSLVHLKTMIMHSPPQKPSNIYQIGKTIKDFIKRTPHHARSNSDQTCFRKYEEKAILSETPSKAPVNITRNCGTDDTRLIGDYKILDQIAEGATSVVYKGVHRLLNFTVAIKIINKADTTKIVPLHKIYREIEIMKSINHKNIVAYFDSFEIDDKIVIIMEYVSNGPSINLLNGGNRLSEAKLKLMFSQLVDAVEYLHSKKIIHRDIKIENILLDHDMNYKLGDFGLSTDHIDRNQTFCGSPCYVAPEVAMKQPYDESADIWSLGVVLYLFATGSYPFADSNIQKLFYKIINEDVTFPSFVGSDLCDLIRKMLEKDPKNRITINGIRKHKWFSVVLTSPSLQTYISEEEMKIKIKNELEMLGFEPEIIQDCFNSDDRNLKGIIRILKYKNENSKRRNSLHCIAQMKGPPAMIKPRVGAQISHQSSAKPTFPSISLRKGRHFAINHSSSSRMQTRNAILSLVE